MWCPHPSDFNGKIYKNGLSRSTALLSSPELREKKTWAWTGVAGCIWGPEEAASPEALSIINTVGDMPCRVMGWGRVSSGSGEMCGHDWNHGTWDEVEVGHRRRYRWLSRPAQVRSPWGELESPTDGWFTLCRIWSQYKGWPHTMEQKRGTGKVLLMSHSQKPWAPTCAERWGSRAGPQARAGMFQELCSQHNKVRKQLPPHLSDPSSSFC